MKKIDWIRLVGSIGVCLLAGFVGSFFTIPAIPQWYASLAKPALAPPSWVFGPAWTTLYVLMGVALYLVWKKGWKRADVRFAMIVFGIQLALNTLWSVIFFGLQNPALAFVDIVLMWCALLWTMIVFKKLSRPAVYLLIPYFVWVSFAAYLNFAIWRGN